jgi:CheY-like chemotaxis protein
MSMPSILVVDSDEGFGFMLKEGLENSGHYQARCVHTGADALQAIVEEDFDLVIIDIALTDMSPITLTQAVREAKSKMRIMMIPMIGQSLPPEVEELSINGVLTKPFFVGDLPDLIDEAIGRPRRPASSPVVATSLPFNSPAPTTSEEVTSTAFGDPPGSDTALQEPVSIESAPESAMFPAAATVSQDTIRYLRSNEAEILRLLDDLNREVRAEAILLIVGPELIAQAGMLTREKCYELAMLVAQSSQAAVQAARFLGESAGRFAQSLHEGEEYRLYTLSLSEGILLSLALSSNVPLGMIRHQCRQIADQLTNYII